MRVANDRADKVGRADRAPAAAPRRKRRSSGEITDLILAAATREFGECGYAGATTAAIARRAGVTEAQIFRLFDSKQQLFRTAIFQPLNTHFAAFFSEGDGGAGGLDASGDAARAYIGELQGFMEQNARMLMSMIVASAYTAEDGSGADGIAGLQAYFDSGAAMSARRLGGTARVDPRLMVRVSFAAVLANVLFKDWLFPAGMASEEAIRHAIAEFVIDGIGANQPAS